MFPIHLDLKRSFDAAFGELLQASLALPHAVASANAAATASVAAGGAHSLGKLSIFATKQTNITSVR